MRKTYYNFIEWRDDAEKLGYVKLCSMDDHPSITEALDNYPDPGIIGRWDEETQTGWISQLCDF